MWCLSAIRYVGEKLRELWVHLLKVTIFGENFSGVLHSDQGRQYQHKHYQKMLKDKGIRQSMSQKGNCLGNACAENFFSLLKTELLYLQEFDSVEHFISELHAYIE